MNSSGDPTSPRSPLAPYPPYPAQEKSRAPEFYGFVAWTSTYALFLFYVLWALLPDTWIEWFGIEWYPNRCVQLPLLQPCHSEFICREWAILIPAYSVILILLTYLTYWSIALYNTPSFADICTVTGWYPVFNSTSCHSLAFPPSTSTRPYVNAFYPA